MVPNAATEMCTAMGVPGDIEGIPGEITTEHELM